VRFSTAVALDDVTVEVPGGSVVAVVGGDGSGQVDVAARAGRRGSPDGGTVEAPPKQRLGYLPASSGSWAALTVTQNIDFVAGIYGLAGDELTARRAELLDRAALTPAAGRLAAQLSGGMRRKLGFVMAIVHRPAPADPRRAHHGHRPGEPHRPVAAGVGGRASGAAVLMSTTYLDEAERAGHLVVLDRGRVLLQGSYDQVRADFTGVITRTDQPVRAEWAWRRGRVLHEYWPGGAPSSPSAPPSPPAGTTAVAPDLEDIVIALSLARRDAVRS